MRVATMTVTVLVLYFLLSGGGVRGADSKNTPEDKAAAAADDLLNCNLPEIKLKNNALSFAIEFLHDATGANIYVDWQSLASLGVKQNAPVTYQARNIKLSEILAAILSSAAHDPKKLVYCTDGGVIFISTPDAQKLHRESWEKHRGMPTDKLKSEKPTLHQVGFAASSFSDVLDFLRDTAGDDIKIDWEKMHQSGIERDTPLTLDLRDVPTLMVLQLVAESASSDKTQVDYKIDGSTIEFFAVAKRQK